MKSESTEDIAAVKQLAENYAAAWAKGDPASLLDCYADDAVVIMSHEDPTVGSTYASVATPKPGVGGEPIRDSGVTLLIVKR